MDGVAVSGDVPHFSIDMASQEPDFWQARWRADLPEPIPAAVLSNAEAMSRFQGCLLCPLQLQLISPDDSPTHYAEDISSPHASRREDHLPEIRLAVIAQGTDHCRQALCSQWYESGI